MQLFQIVEEFQITPAVRVEQIGLLSRLMDLLRTMPGYGSTWTALNAARICLLPPRPEEAVVEQKQIDSFGMVGVDLWAIKGEVVDNEPTVSEDGEKERIKPRDVPFTVLVYAMLLLAKKFVEDNKS